MTDYHAPLRDFEFLFFELFNATDTWSALPPFADFSQDLVTAILVEGDKLASEVLAPLNQSGSEEGATWDDGVVTTPAGFKEAFAALTQGGWLSVAGHPDYEGQGMPKMMSCALEEMFWAANTSLYLYGTLTVGSAICIESHGTSEQKALYLPKLYSGEWTGAMALTEAHSGTDLGIMRTKAVPNADGSFAITGSKVFITAGEHDLVDNIVHLVLAKLPDAPAGSRGISLFIVPKLITDSDGILGERNTFSSGSIEHKMGINASATCVMNYDSAVGYLLGGENQGLAAMFTMMNYERLSVGIQGLGAGELAYQNAVAYATERLQGRGPNGPVNPDGVADSILEHPDVRRMLLTMRAYTEGGRAFALFVGMQLDLAKHANDEAALKLSQLLTPIAKAFLTDRGFEAAVLGQQVFGGHGYVREWGMEQIVRDARIGQIYEGTNGVQALDLVGRKVLRDGGQAMRNFADYMAADEVADDYQKPLVAACDALVRVTSSLVERSADQAALPGAVSVDYLELSGLVIYAWLWAKMAAAAPADEFGDDKKMLAEYYYARLLPKILFLEESIQADASAVTSLPSGRF